MTALSLTISILALILSITVAWFTLFRRGKLKMTKPAFIAFCYDKGKDGKPLAKIFIRALLYSTGKRGQVIENMYLLVQNRDRREIFNVWGHGDEKLLRGSGMFIGETGVSTNHHFNPIPDSDIFEYLLGDYNIQIFATFPRGKKSVHICTVDIKVDDFIQQEQYEKSNTSIWFDWQPDKANYHAHLEHSRKML